MQVISISSDRKIFEEGSAVCTRAISYGTLFDELHIIVFTRKFLKTKSYQLSANCWVYPTNSWSRWLYIFDAVRVGKRIIENCKLKIENSRNNFVITGQDPFECGLAAYKLSKKFHIPLHVQIHTDFLSPYFKKTSFLNRLRIRIARKVLPHASAIRVVSERIKDSLLQKTTRPNVSESVRYGRESYKLKAVPAVLPIFTDISKITAAIPMVDLQQKYSRWGFIILIAGRFTEEKNFGFALRILHELVKKYPQTGMVIVGEGPELFSLKLKAKSYKLEASVAFEGWQKDLVSYYKTANLFLMTSLYEGFGLTLLEAVAAGCPSVSSDVGIAPELLTHKGHSFVCPVNDLDCFVRKISELIEDNQLRKFFSLEIAPSAITPFTISKEEYLAKYKASIEAAAGK